MRCPSQENLNKIASILTNENDEQVGTFVSSYLKNLRETSDPHKQDAANLVKK